jgi:hypothetical protein
MKMRALKKDTNPFGGQAPLYSYLLLQTFI